MEPVIIDEYLYERGRGPELRSCRLTVNELYPSLVDYPTSDARMLELYPITPAELDAVKRYIAANAEELAKTNAEIDARIARKVAEQDTPEFRAQMEAGRERVQLMKVWLGERKSDPTLFEEIPGEPTDARRERYFAAFNRWRAARALVSEVG
jgi:hypothetical protein